MAIRKLLAYAAIYVLWGASFLAIRQVVAVTPPFFAASFRFLCAGGILYAYSRAKGMPQPNRRQWISTAVLGLVMFAGDYGCLFWAEKEVPSGLAAVIAATIPVWVLLGEWLFAGSQRPTAKSLVGIVLGIAGVVLLMLPAGLHSSGFTTSALVLLMGCLLWAGGTVTSRHLQLPKQLSMSSGLQMAWGGGFLFLISAATGELGKLPALSHRWDWHIVFAMAYLIIFHHRFYRLCLAHRAGSDYPCCQLCIRQSADRFVARITPGRRAAHAHPVRGSRPGSGRRSLHHCRQTCCTA
jgi:drug/metabolite transporter (DMT)-like permease